MSRELTSATGVAVTGFTGSAPQQVSAISLATDDWDNLSVLFYAKATTNTLTVTGKWQVSADGGSNWYDVYVENNAALVAQVTGTGSAVTATRVIDAPEAVYGWPNVRFVAVSGVGSGGGAGTDEASVTYRGTRHIGAF
jgi:hypothetical protein